MNANRSSFNLFRILLAVVVLAISCRAFLTEQVLHRFGQKGDGSVPDGGLVMDAAGYLCGTTFAGGSGNCRVGNVSGCGTVYELTPTADGKWTETVIYSFAGVRGGQADGANPTGDLIFDPNGSLYGVTQFG